jgi:xanthine dehydrogenase large subunit
LCPTDGAKPATVCVVAAAALAAAPHRLAGTFANGAQDHFYLEGQIALAVPQEGGEMAIWSSTQHPTEVQKMVAGALDLPAVPMNMGLVF